MPIKWGWPHLHTSPWDAESDWYSHLEFCINHALPLILSLWWIQGRDPVQLKWWDRRRSGLWDETIHHRTWGKCPTWGLLEVTMGVKDFGYWQCLDRGSSVIITCRKDAKWPQWRELGGIWLPSILCLSVSLHSLKADCLRSSSFSLSAFPRLPELHVFLKACQRPRPDVIPHIHKKDLVAVYPSSCVPKRSSCTHLALHPCQCLPI